MGEQGKGRSRGSGNYSGRPARVGGKDKEPGGLEPEIIGTIEGPKQTSTGGTATIRDHEQQGTSGTNSQEGSMGFVQSRENTRPEETQLMREPNSEYYQEKATPLLKAETRPDSQHSGNTAGLVVQIGSEINDDNHAPRIPLQDCTNTVRAAGKVSGEDRTMSTRGQ